MTVVGLAGALSDLSLAPPRKPPAWILTLCKLREEKPVSSFLAKAKGIASMPLALLSPEYVNPVTFPAYALVCKEAKPYSGLV